MDRRAHLTRVVPWARQDDTIRAVVVAGSIAHADRAVTALSERDSALSVADPSELLGDNTWPHRVGEVLVVEALVDPVWYRTRPVSTAGTIDVMGTAGVLPNGAPDERPVRVPIDTDNVRGAFRRSPRDQPPPPIIAEVLRCVPGFSVAVMWTTCLARDEPRAARMRDGDSTAQIGGDDDTWDNGTHLRVWRDADLLRREEARWWGPSLRQSTRALRDSRSPFDIAQSVPRSVRRSTQPSAEHRIEEGILLAPARLTC